MTEHVPRDAIEPLVGAKRNRVAHLGRANTEQGMVYILHSQACLDSGIDLRECRFSVACDTGLNESMWDGYTDVPVVLGVWNGLLIPIRKWTDD